ncbi:MAG: hypothetical protein COT91_01120 [Candidatus Doudnabacteria bacterium CG10_big_fil_rev_8_21_14_0_10_41_10]|uniref:Uncharacterized protein n=1 Tax=Candidatus Doudnabacteria bacterium CG10_big_fil_rev_8_21_14_0_10_41_10 TaxID=1974551 RepID=A0A2H0VEC2_9BACT|nr:MAG: hypothetical protein COT91_01120 [Candidatus Doudnabacteria bacterium CG10_big_fil_rev_8_21_14_0_10_41_10]
MNSLLTVFTTIIALFFLLLAVKSLFKGKFCVICSSISFTWATYLVLNKLGYFQDTVLLGILMGQTVVGIYYLIDRKIKEDLRIFRLPFILSLTLAAYFTLNPVKEGLPVFLLLVILWVVFILTYTFRRQSGFGGFVKKIIECCKNW